MQILIPDSWLREYLDTDATPKQIQTALSLCGPSIERLHEKNNDYVYDTEVTTNRVDMMSIIGIAFECVAILPRFGHKASLKKDPYTQRSKLVTSTEVDYLRVRLDKALCPRFSAVLIRNVQVESSPKWLANRLELAGLRCLNNVVDISNYLMLEMGQPVHIFDYDKIANSKMILRESQKGEELITLDSKKHVLPGGDIIIEDGSGRLIDLCGIMGGLSSAVDKNTKNVLLFVQVYEPTHIRKTSMALAHRTDAAVLFEKDLPVENVLPTLKMGVQLFEQLIGGKAEKTVLDILSVPESNSNIKLHEPIDVFTAKRLGVTLTLSEISKILNSLEFKVHSQTEIEVPWVRKKDVGIPEDIVEEIARIYGYHNLPTSLMSGSLPTNRPNDAEFYWLFRIKSALKYWGFTETYTYSLVENDIGLKLKNPLSSDWTYLRTKLVPSLLKIATENLGRISELNLFEIANVYTPKPHNLPEENLHLAIATTKNRSFLKGIVESLFNQEMNISVGFNDGKEVSFDPQSSIWTFEINLSPLIPRASKYRSFAPISKFSPIIEDINLKLDEPYDKLVQKLKRVSPLIKHIGFLDKYSDKITLRLTYHSNSKQLTKDDIAPLRPKLQSISG